MQSLKLSSDSKILVIRINHSNKGFFAYLTFALNQILYAEKNNMVPVIYFGPWSVDGPNLFHDPERGDNMWDYFFEPVNGYTYGDILLLIKDPEHPLTEKNLVHLEDDMISYLHAGNPSSIYNYPYGFYNNLEEDANNWYARQREKAQRLIKQYIRVKKELVNEVEQYLTRHFNQRHILGVHIRGTDKGSNSEALHIAKIISPKKYYAHIDSYIQKHPDAKIFLATDQEQYVTQMRRRYPNRLLTQSTILSKSHVNAFQKNDGKNYQKGKEVLLDCLLLARCNYLLKCSSAVGEYAHYFNSDLFSLDLNELHGRPNTLRKLRTFLLADPYTYIRDFVRLAKDPDKSKSALFWHVLTDYPLVRRYFNSLESKLFTRSTFSRSLLLTKRYISFLRNKEEIPFRQVRQLAIYTRKRKGADYYSFSKAKGKKYLEIRTDGDPQAAFFAQFLYVLQQIRFAEVHQLIPIVNLDHAYNYYFDKGYGENVWENYFEPVSGISSSALDTFNNQTITFLRPEQQRLLFLGEGDEPPVNYDDKTRRWWQNQRSMGARLTAQYISLRPEIKNIVDDFYQSQLKGHTVLGLHLRGTDKSVRFDGKPFQGPDLFTRIIPPEEYFPFIDEFLSQNPEGKLFVATDQRQFMDTLVKRYSYKVINTGAIRSSNEKAVFSRSGSGYLRGVEVLKDSLLLSKCDFLIKCMSNVGEVAVYFNPNMPVIDVFYPHKVDDFNNFFVK